MVVCYRCLPAQPLQSSAKQHDAERECEINEDNTTSRRLAFKEGFSSLASSNQKDGSRMLVLGTFVSGTLELLHAKGTMRGRRQMFTFQRTRRGRRKL